jgi:anti-sigma B factor antagonist
MTEQLTLTTVPHPSSRAAVVALAGVMDMGTAAALQEALLDLVDCGSVHLVLDLSRVSFCDSMGLNALLRAHRHAHSNHGTLALCGIADPVARVLAITGADTIIPQHPTTTEALDGIDS